LIKKLPTVSNYQVFKNRKNILKNPLPFHHNNFDTLGDIFKVKIGPSGSIVFTRSPEFIKQILQKNHKNYNKSPLQTRDLSKYIGKGLLTSNGEHWRTHRRMIQPAFHKKKLVGLLDTMDQAIKVELERIVPGETQDIYPLMGDLAFQTVAKSLFTRDDIQREMTELKTITANNQKMLIREMRQPYLKWWYTWSGEINRHLKLTKKARHILNEIIEQRIRSKQEKDDLLDMLLEAKYEDASSMSREQLIDEVLILFAAGHETTANALGFTLYLLAKNREIQEKAFQEVAKVDLDNTDVFNNLTVLTYTKQCVEEGMRLYPPAYYIDRMSIGEDQLGEYSIPKDTMLLLAIYELHRDADFWDNPESFLPDRFEASKKKNYSDYYYPFGAGPRMCIGNNFAMYEMVLTIARILKKYRMTTEIEEIEINPLISLKPKEVPIRFIPRL
jgi:hypothetical protein